MESHISIAAEKIGHIGAFPITNSLIFSWIVVGVLSIFAYLAGRKTTTIPQGLQGFIELILEPVYNITHDLAHSKAKVIFPFVATFFIYIMVANLFGLFPGIGTIGIWDDHHVLVPLFRPVNTDLNMTLGLSIISVIITHFLAVKYLGIFGYLKKWFSLNPIFLFVGLLELVSEGTKMLSLSLRLFGNIFAGEVVLVTVSGLLAFVAPLPFYFLEIIVAVVQAAVFAMLTLVFMVLLTEKHEAH
ncbi:MAG: ATP synthase subunit a [Candidatus Daviesbacteria bacterium GW2011_GWA2_38_24]|uniref:ATP synthase subunit a n=1 Tax=Candidatus Daviesbacteria bacterium GW2011_GWA2_38_24 TaxID=1618422 RepID=A0A0G0JTT1_9BACT|nr:MAG: ATP synthase subunit a [Candidatus Daviesbacteria bacterium GW2011_GWA2_38_24]KKQ78672.1 MAG: ATP synthase subunit a [Candidatus Daviesbacteria bacterium GW2011_GWA1_38_7]OGE24234.1 MAG: ATP synthase F0 subunit A [Candidatus Daviesbacteria bacterium RIFCSPHIGHO2_01_FULL_38_8]